MTEHRRGASDDPLGGRTIIAIAHWVTMVSSGLVVIPTLVVTVFGSGPKGSTSLGLLLVVVAAATIVVTWWSLDAFRRTDQPRLGWMALVGMAWFATLLVAAGA